MSRKWLVLCMVGLFAVMSFAAGCGNNQKKDAAGSGEKVLRIGTNADFAPFEFQDVNGKEYEGCLIPFEEGKKEYHVTVYME